MNEYLNVTILIEKTARWVGDRPLKFSEFVSGECEDLENIVVKYSNSNSIIILRNREALVAYQCFFKDVTKQRVVWFEQEFSDVFFDNDLDGIVVEKTIVSEEEYIKIRLAISN